MVPPNSKDPYPSNADQSPVEWDPLYQRQTETRVSTRNESTWVYRVNSKDLGKNTDPESETPRVMP